MTSSYNAIIRQSQKTQAASADNIFLLFRLIAQRTVESLLSATLALMSNSLYWPADRQAQGTTLANYILD
jgi:hypothetical protein